MSKTIQFSMQKQFHFHLINLALVRSLYVKTFLRQAI